MEATEKMNFKGDTIIEFKPGGTGSIEKKRSTKPQSMKNKEKE
jgi:hypothetical protein